MSLDSIVKTIEAQYGQKSAIILSDESALDIEVIPTGISVIDKAIGAGGVPRGRITEIFGAEASGKTTLCLHTIVQAQKQGLGVGFIDAEHALNKERMLFLGVDPSNFVLSQPQSGEEALEVVELMLLSGEFGIIVVDSVAALTPMSEIERDMGESSMGVHARLMSQAMRKLAAPVAKANVALVFTNQTRANIGGYGSPNVTTGGKALKFYSSLRMEMKYKGKIVDSTGQRVSGKYVMTVVKNKLAIPYREAEFEINQVGIDESGGVIDALISAGVIQKAGSWYRHGEVSLAQGAQALKARFNAEPELLQELLAQMSP